MVTARDFINREYEGKPNGEHVVHAACRRPWITTRLACRYSNDASGLYPTDDTQLVTCLQCLAKL